MLWKSPPVRGGTAEIPSASGAMENSKSVRVGRDGRSFSSHFLIQQTFARLLPPLDGLARAALKDAIAADGKARDAIVVGVIPGFSQPVLLDGHHRVSIIEELRSEKKVVIEPKIVEIPFESAAEAAHWVINNQNARRNWEPWDRARAVLENQAAIAELKRRAKKNEQRGKTLSSAEERAQVDQTLARIAGVSKNTIHRARFVLEHGTPQLVDRLSQPVNGSRPSLASAFHAAQAAKRDRDNHVRRNQPQPPKPVDDGGWENQLLSGDAREVLKRVPGGAATLFVCSPPYPLPDELIGYDVYRYPGFQRWLTDLEEVMREAFRTLRRGGRVAINIDATNDREEEGSSKIDVHYWVSKVMADIGFRFMDEIVWFKQNNSGTRPSWGTYMSPRKPNVRRNHEYVLIYCKETPILDGNDELNDIAADEFHNGTMSTWNYDPKSRSPAAPGSFWYIKSQARDGTHPCPYPLGLAEVILKLFSRRGDLIVDPYSGSGTTCLAAMINDRRYFGIDLSEAYTQAAIARLVRAAAAAAKKAPAAASSKRRPSQTSKRRRSI